MDIETAKAVARTLIDPYNGHGLSEYEREAIERLLEQDEPLHVEAEAFDRQWESNKSHMDGTHPLTPKPHVGKTDEMCWSDEMCWCGVVHHREDDDRSAW